MSGRLLASGCPRRGRTPRGGWCWIRRAGCRRTRVPRGRGVPRGTCSAPRASLCPEFRGRSRWRLDDDGPPREPRGPPTAASQLVGATRKSGKGGSKEAETFESDPVRGDLAPRPAKGRAQPEPSVARDPVNGNAKRTQGARGPCIEPRKGMGRGGRRHRGDGRQHSRASARSLGSSSGVQDHGTCARGSPRNLGGPAVCTLSQRTGYLPEGTGSTEARGQPKRRRKDGGESERLTTEEAGELAPGDPAEG